MCYRFSYLSHRQFYGVFQFIGLSIKLAIFTSLNFDFAQVTHTYAVIFKILAFSKLLAVIITWIKISTYLFEFLITKCFKQIVGLRVASLAKQMTSEYRGALWTTVYPFKPKFC